MVIEHDVDLTPYTTFGFKQRAAHFVEVDGEQALLEAVRHAQQRHWPILALGGGSNLVFTRDFPGLVIRQIDSSVRYTDATDGNGTHVTSSAGVLWHELVMDTVDRDFIGLENLSLIPGQVGAAPVQNIGAYGVELCDRFVALRALHVPTGEWLTMTAEECHFSYRDSLFKRQQDEYIIGQVTLHIGGDLELNTEYRALAEYLASHFQDRRPDVKLVSESICAIRTSKLPDPARLPNAGSFFHNPVVSRSHYTDLLQNYPDMIGYPQENGSYKLAAGWLIDKLGYKGYRQNGVGVHGKQALVLIKYHQTDAVALIRLAEKIRDHVLQEFQVSLKIEPRIL
ncbi:UDP-N-acetylmuramate dehydrogenase [Granulosicoccus sp. 3-233]|uniref:UDP-N-acetylmuramate dehydrogenase n=1 Tax=Granulosicoccus sp. 3-233 TaxID=3417969 RepID=UPI003D32D7D5